MQAILELSLNLHNVGMTSNYVGGYSCVKMIMSYRTHAKGCCDVGHGHVTRRKILPVISLKRAQSDRSE